MHIGSVVPQLAPAGLVHFRFPFLPLGQVPPAHSGFYHLKDLFAVIVLLQQVLEREIRCLIWNPIADHADPHKSAHPLYLDQHILPRWIAEVVPLQQQMDAQYGREPSRPVSVLAWCAF